MTEYHDQESEFARLLRGMPFDDAPRPEAAANLREQVLARFDAAGQAEPILPWWQRAWVEGRTIMRRPISRLIAGTAACLAVLAAGWLLLGRASDAQAFDRLATAIVNAKTAQFRMEVKIEGQAPQTFKAGYLAPGKYRMETGSLVSLSDFTAGKMVTLMPAEKRAMILNLKGDPKQKQTCDSYFERLRELLAHRRDAKDKEYLPLGEKEIDGRRVVGFRYDSPTATVTLWGSAKTGLPVRIESDWRGVAQAQVVMSDFEVNVDLKESLFDLEPPADYKVQSLDVDTTPSREQDLVRAFKTCSELSGGEYPDTLDMAGLNKLFLRYTMSHVKDISEEKVQGLMKEAVKIGRGFQFAFELPASAEATYAGKGVKRDAKDRPIFWYKPEGSKKYRVLQADLTLREADTAPQVAGAKRIEKAGKTTGSPEK
jgi:outer membrane lipoprotein-sorting protein